MKNMSFFWKLVGGLAAAGILTVPLAADDDGPQITKQRRVVIIDENENEAADIGDRRQNSYWIGIQCKVSDEGVFVGQLVPNTPAEAAGLRANDQIVKVNDTVIDDVGTLVESVQNSQGEAITIEVKRGDENIVVDVTPAQRPPFSDAAQLPRALDRLPFMERFFHDKDFDVQMFHPGFIVPHEAQNFPNNASVKIEKKNDEPAKITIERDGEKWVVDEGSIDKLPKDLQGWAKNTLRQLDNKGLNQAQFFEFDRKRIPEEIRRQFDRLPRRPLLKNRSDEIAELKEEIKQLRKLIEEMQKED